MLRDLLGDDVLGQFLILGHVDIEVEVPLNLLNLVDLPEEFIVVLEFDVKELLVDVGQVLAGMLHQSHLLLGLTELYALRFYLSFELQGVRVVLRAVRGAP